MHPNVHSSTILVAKTWKQPKCPSTDEYTHTHTYTHTMEYYSAIKKNSAIYSNVDGPRDTYSDILTEKDKYNISYGI